MAIFNKTNTHILEFKEVEALGDVSISLSHTNIPIVTEALVSKEQLWDDNQYIDEEEIRDYSETNAEEAYETSPLYILQLLHEYANILRGYRDIALANVSSTKEYLRILDNSEYFTEDEKKERYKVVNKELKTRQKVLDDLTHKIEACEGWDVDDINVCLE